MIKTISFAVILVTSLQVAADINQKVLKIFEKSFRNPREVVWHEYGTYYEVNFKQDEIHFVIRQPELLPSMFIF